MASWTVSSVSCRHVPEVLLARVGIYHGLKKWELMEVVAKKLAELES